MSDQVGARRPRRARERGAAAFASSNARRLTRAARARAARVEEGRAAAARALAFCGQRLRAVLRRGGARRATTVGLVPVPARRRLARRPQTAKGRSAAEIEREQEALLAKKYGGLLRKKQPLMPKASAAGRARGGGRAAADTRF
jgi:hypothetical protein